MTETLIVAAAALAGVNLLFASTSGAVGKIFLLAVVLGCLLLHIVGRALTAPQRLSAAIGEVVRDWWPVMLLSLFIVGGSAYARLVDGMKETLLGFGIGMLFLPLVAIAVRSAARPFPLMKALAVVHVATVLAMIGLLPLGRGPFHEEIFVAVPLGAFFLVAKPLRARQALIGLALLGGCLLSVKNTTFLLVLLTLTACGLVWTARLTAGPDPLRVLTRLYFSAMGVLAVAAALTVGWMVFKSHLPTGSPEYRLEMYTLAWRRFLDSPVWGAGFTDSGVTYFELFRTATETQVLPTHSDVLDLLANGGVIAFGLWVLTVWKLFAIGWDALRTVARGRHVGAAPADAAIGADQLQCWRWLFVLSLLQLCAIVTYAFNPVLLRPVHGFWVWGSAGLMWALHRLLTDGLRGARTVSPRLRRTAFA